MQSHVDTLLGESLRKQAQHHHAQEQRRSQPSEGFLCKVNGTRLRSAAAKLRKRPREAGESTVVRHEDENDYDWPSVLLNALQRVVTSIESEGTPTDDVLAQSPSLAFWALTTLTGIELRHGMLQAPHIHAAQEKGHACLSPWLFSSRRPWNAAGFSSLTTLDLECNALGDVGVSVLCTHVVIRLPRLQRLLLASNGVTAVGFAALLITLSLHGASARSPLPLEVLGLTNNAVGSQEGAAFVEWVDAVQNFVRAFAATLRRIHLNHAGLYTRDAVALLGALFQYTGGDRTETCVLDLVYLRENKQLSHDEVMGELQQMTASPEALHAFLAKHISW